MYRKRSPSTPSRRSIELNAEPVKYLSEEEWQRLRETIDNLRDKLIIRMIYELGCRVGEFTTLRIRDVDFDRGTAYFRAENTKTKQARCSIMSRELTNDLKGYVGAKQIMKCPDRSLFKTRQGNGISISRVQQIVKRYAEKASIQRAEGESRLCSDRGGNMVRRKLNKVTVHALRHSHVIHRLAEGNPVNVVQQQVGHKNLSTTQIYTRVRGDDILKSYRARSDY